MKRNVVNIYLLIFLENSVWRRRTKESVECGVGEAKVEERKEKKGK